MSGDSQATSAEHWQVVVVGAGAAGLVAGAVAAQRGKRTLILEKNRKPGVKILMSGGTRCNLTHATDNRGIVEAFGPQGKFLHSALSALSVDATIQLFNALGVPTKAEPTGKIFPSSDRAADVLAALVRWVKEARCATALDEALCEIEPEGASFRLRTAKRTLLADNVIITTGGQSYPGCGTVGEGYAWAARFGHAIVPPRPALVPITTDADWVRRLKGITVPDVAIELIELPAAAQASRHRSLDRRRGSLLFTHFGLSGPVVLDISREVSGHPRQHSLALKCDFLPGMKHEELDAWLRNEAASAGKRAVIGILDRLLPRRLCEALLTSADVTAEAKAAELGQRARSAIAKACQSTLVPISGTLGFKKAEVTAGGVSLAEIDSRTMQSKLQPNLYLAGEVLDLDGPIGGYNFQAAWSTGYLAGKSV